MNQPFITFDIETGPNQRALEFVPEFEPPENIKDPQKIEARRLEHYEKAIEKAALDALMGQVLAIGIKHCDREPSILGNGLEGLLLGDFWHFITEPDTDGPLPLLVGFNSHSFDLPFLLQRSWILGVTVPSWVRQGRYWDRRFIDLREVWTTGHHREFKGSLDSICRACGLGSNSTSGAEFHKLWESDRPKAIEYLKNDIKLTEALALRLGVNETQERRLGS